MATPPRSGDAVVDAALSRARVAQQAWAKRTLSQRLLAIGQMRDALLGQRHDVVQAAVALGKSRGEAVALELVPALLSASFVLTRAETVLRDAVVQAALPHGRHTVVRQLPRGVCGLIAPRNYGLSIPASTVFAALVCGNTVVIKPGHHQCTLTRFLAQAAAVVAPDLVQVLDDSDAHAAALVEGDIDHLTFIGSTRVGRRVAARAGERLLPCILELGGKAPAIVLANADVKRTARAIAFARLANAGASCVAVERVLVDDSQSDALQSALFEAFTAYPAMRALPDHVEAAIEQAHARGCTVHRLPQAVVVDVTGHEDLALLTSEMFAPVLAWSRFRTHDEALRLANDAPLQLAAYVFGDNATAGRIAQALRAPSVLINDAMTQYSLNEVPFSGSRDSGLGTIHGDAGLLALCVQQAITTTPSLLGTLLPTEPWWPPHDDNLATLALDALPSTTRLIETLWPSGFRTWAQRRKTRQ